MNVVRSAYIRHVLIYKGHETHSLLGPYAANVTKQKEMFEYLNSYRMMQGRPLWEVTAIAGEVLVNTLQQYNPKETLLVIPAGQSSHLDKVFHPEQVDFIKNRFLAEGGGRLYATCGASYAMSSIREYYGLSTEHPDKQELSIKEGLFRLFEGRAKGPLCPFPGQKYQVGFYSDAVTVTNGIDRCNIYLSGGGSFLINETTQKVKVLVTYLDSELTRLGKPLAEHKDLENATILTQVGKGTALLSMFHPYYGSSDFHVATYENAFPDCGTNWKEMHERLSPLETRMQFVLNAMLYPLEDAGFAQE